jgi:hypothetical protein
MHPIGFELTTNFKRAMNPDLSTIGIMVTVFNEYNRVPPEF